VTCLECGYVSIAFDPMNSIQVPIAKEQTIDVIYVPQNIEEEQTLVYISILKGMTVADLKAKYAKKMEVDIKSLVCLLKTQNDKVEFIKDNRKLTDIENDKFYTMIYEVAAPGEQQPQPEAED